MGEIFSKSKVINYEVVHASKVMEFVEAGWFLYGSPFFATNWENKGDEVLQAVVEIKDE